MLQTRNGKRTGYAAVVIATDLVGEKLVTPKDAVLMVEPEALSQLLAPIFDPKEWKALPVATKGSAGVAGRARPARSCSPPTTRSSGRGRARRCMLVRKETVPDDIHGHVRRAGHPDGDRRHDVARARSSAGRWASRRSSAPARSQIDEHGQDASRVGGATLKEGDWLSFDGLTRRSEGRTGRDASRARSCRSSTAR